MKKVIAEETLGQRIKAQRIRKHLTQEMLAETMCIPKSTVSAYENDRVDIKGSVLVEISQVLCTTPNYLLGVEGLASDNMEIIELYNGISDEKIRKSFLVQIKAISKNRL